MTTMNTFTLLIADANGHHGHWWIVFPILWLSLLAFAITVWWRRGRSAGGDPARRILGERFARGEIDVDEYRRRLSQLQ
jgi:putative membrane protein